MTRINIVIASLLLALLCASDANAADVFGKTPIKTTSIGDVTIVLAGADNSTIAQVIASNGAAATNGLYTLPGLVNSTLPTNTAGRAAAISLDVGGRVYVTGDAAMTALAANITKIGGSSIALGQAAMAASLPVVLSSNQSTLNVTQGAPSGATWNKASVVNIAAAGTSAIVCKSGVAVSTPTKPLQYVITAPGAVRCQLRYNDNSTLTQFTDVVTTPGYGTVVWQPPSGVVGLTTSATSTTQQYEANCTNFDATAQDVGCTVVYCSSATGC